MKKLVLILFMVTSAIGVGLAQQAAYLVTAGNGNGLKFWSDDSYKIHMGQGTEYYYGPVNDYSIKTNMSSGRRGVVGHGVLLVRFLWPPSIPLVETCRLPEHLLPRVFHWTVPPGPIFYSVKMVFRGPASREQEGCLL